MEFLAVTDGYVVRLARGELIIETLQGLCEKLGIEGGFFYGLGAVDEVELAHYNVDDKEYSAEVYGEPFELTNITGSIGMYENEVVVHAHVSLADMNMRAVGGHLVEGRVSGTLELFLKKLDRLEKQDDKETGLKVFDLKR